MKIKVTMKIKVMKWSEARNIVRQKNQGEAMLWAAR